MQTMRRLLITLALLPLLSACALFGMGPGRTLELAQADHRHCLNEGYSYPSDSYAACRRTLAEIRQRKTWSELQLTKQNDSIIPPVQRDRMSGYRPIREENFYCYPEILDNTRYILCKQTR